MGVSLRVRLTRRLLAVTPPLAASVLWLRRKRGKAGVTRVLATPDAVHRQYGVSPRRVTLGSAETVSLTTVSNARVLAQPAAIVGSDWSLLWPFSPQLKRRPYGADVLWKRLLEERGKVGRAVYAGADGFSYYHWLTGTVPKLLVARRDVQQTFDAFLVNPRHKGKENFQTETLRLLDIPADKVVWLERRTHVVCEQLTLPPEPCLTEQTQITPWAHSLLRETFLPLVGERTATSPEKIFISRAKARRRRLVNEAEIESRLMAQGFVTVVLEDLPFLEQVRLFAHAREIVGLHGAGLTNLVFSAPGTRVVEIASDAWRNPCFANIAKVGRLNHRIIVGRSVGPRRGFASDVLINGDRVLSLMGQ